MCNGCYVKFKMMVVIQRLRRSQLVFLALLVILLSNCEQKYPEFQYEDSQYTIKQIGKMPDVVNEGSGLVFSKDSSLWTLNDGGGAAEIYKVSRSGQLLATLQLPGAKNNDWEELSADNRGNLYVGDIGNNLNWRHDLVIYRVDPAKSANLAKIQFRYADQQAFPPDTKERNFDCEAFFWYQDRLYLFSKNRGRRLIKIYSLPATPGNYVATVVDSTYLSSPADANFFDIQVTAASVSTDQKTFALLTYDGIFLFTIQNGRINFRYPQHYIKLNNKHVRQIEALSFMNQTDFLFTNEQQTIFLARKKIE